MNNVLFKEQQRFIVFIYGITIISIYIGALYFLQISSQEPIKKGHISGSLLLLFFAGSVLLGVFLYAQKLRLIITDEEIVLSFGVLTAVRVIKIDKIKTLAIREYDAIKEFGGWGVRYNKTNESCFTVSGNIGIEI